MRPQRPPPRLLATAGGGHWLRIRRWPSVCSSKVRRTALQRRSSTERDNQLVKVRARDPRQAWKEDFESSPTRDDGIETSTISGIPLKPLYTTEEIPSRAEEFPGQFPYTRGIHSS